MIQCDAGLLPRIDALKAEHPFWGDRRTRAYLRFVEHLAVSNQRILRLLREQHLLVPPNLRPRAKWTPTGRKPRPTKPQAWWGLDLTKVRGTGFGWISIVVVLDGYPKQLVSCDAGVHARRRPGSGGQMDVSHMTLHHSIRTRKLPPTKSGRWIAPAQNDQAPSTTDQNINS